MYESAPSVKPSGHILLNELSVFFILFCIWLFMILLVGPIGDFPLVDDWAFAHPVHSLVSHGKLHFMDWQDMTLIAQVFWGWLFCLPLGFSFTALRISTLVLGLGGIFATYILLKESKVDRRFAFLGALLVAVNPLYFMLSNTFMTDVPFFACSMFSFLFFARVIRRGDNRYLLSGVLLACVAVFIRQIAVVIPLAFAVTYLSKNGIHKKTVLTVFFPILILVGMIALYHFWLHHLFGLPVFFSPKFGYALTFLHLSITQMVDKISLVWTKTLAYLGLFILPVLLPLLVWQWQRSSFQKKAWLIVFVTGISYWLCISITSNPKLLIIPEQGNILRHYGIDPVSMYGSAHLVRSFAAPWSLLVLVVIVSSIGGAILIMSVCLAIIRFFVRKNYGASDELWTGLFAFVTSLLYCITLPGVHFWDRYLIFLLPFPALLLADCKDPGNCFADLKKLFVPLVVLLAYGVFTVCLTHDYLSWNKARWEALSYLTLERKIPPQDIDGGFEFNGLFNYSPRFKTCETNPLFWVAKNPEYLVSFGPVTGFEKIKTYPYKRWFPFREDPIFILHSIHRQGREAR